MEDTRNVEIPSSATDDPHNKPPLPFLTPSSNQHHSVEPASTFPEPENQEPKSQDGEKDYVHMCMSNIVNLPSLCTRTRCELMDTFQ